MNQTFPRAIWAAALTGTIAIASQLHARTDAPASKATTLRTPDEDVGETLAELTRTHGLPAYVLLRHIWQRWEDARPAVVEQALRTAGKLPTLRPPERAYAGALSALARLRRGDATSAERTFTELGYVHDWWVVGAFDNEGKAGFAERLEPELNPLAPIVPGQAFQGKERPVRYRPLPSVFPYGWIDLGAILRPEENICAYLTTAIENEKEARPATLWVGASGAHKVIWNGSPVLEDDSYRGFDFDRRQAPVWLAAGPNRVLLKVCGADQSPLLSVRLGDAEGAPLTGVHPIKDLASWTAKPVGTAPEAAPRKTKPSSTAAPLDEVGRILSDTKATAEALEAAAAYLDATGGDDEAKHPARELAERASKAEPTVARFLLAATFAEDRNGVREKLEAARRLPGPVSPEQELELILAEASLERSGPNPRSAFPLYDKALKLDPLCLPAVRGHVDLLNHAGLYQTALREIESVWRLLPSSVVLSNMMASQLERMGELTRARGYEETYSAARMDDASLWSDRLDLALRRHNAQATEHYLDRLRMGEPESLWAHRMTAEAHRQLGQRERSYTDLRLALDQAPDDTTLRSQLAGYLGKDGRTTEQLAQLREILRLRPQNAEVRKYVEHMAPPLAAPDEKFAMASSQFLETRLAPAQGHARRTLRDLTVTTVYESGLSRQFRQVVFQPLTDNSAALSRQYAFQYQADTQQVQLMGARVYRMDGTTAEAIESGEGAANDPSIAMYTSARTFYVQFPRLEPGDVVELRYSIEDVTPRNEFADYFGDVVALQSDEPVQNAEYVLIVPKSRKVYFDVQGLKLQEQHQTTDAHTVHRFFAKSVAPITPEPAMAPWSEILGFIHVSTYPTWDALGKWYWGLVFEQLDLDPKTRELAATIAKDKTTTEEKVRAVYEWVVKNTRYVALEFGIYGFKPRRCVQTVARGWGDCKDKATVIVTLLRELGIPANLVILRTNTRGRMLSPLSSLAPFDHAIAYVPELNLYLDGTAEYSGMRELPGMDQGALGLVIEDGKARKVELPLLTPAQNYQRRTAHIELDKSGDANLDVTFEALGDNAPAWRSRYEAKATLRERLAEDFAHEYPGLVLSPEEVETSDLTNLEGPAKVRLRAKVPEFARREGNLFRAQVTVDSHLTTNYASRSSRALPVILDDHTSRYSQVTLTIPAGMQVDMAPTPTRKETKFGRYEVKYHKEGRTIVVESSLELLVRRVEPADYAAFRQFCLAADEALGRRLTLSPAGGAQ